MAGAKKEKALFAALVHKYGPEPEGEPHEGPDLPHEHPAGILTADRPGGTKHSRPKASGSRQQPKPRVLRINLLTLDATKRGDGLTLDYARESLQPIHSALDHLAKKVGGTPELFLDSIQGPRTQNPRPGSGTQNPQPDSGSSVVRLVLHVEGLNSGERVDEQVVADMQELVRTRHRIGRNGRTGLLLALGDLEEHERRRLDKERSLQKQKGRTKRAVR